MFRQLCSKKGYMQLVLIFNDIKLNKWFKILYKKTGNNAKLLLFLVR